MIGVGGHQFQKIMTRNIKWNTLGLPKFIIFLRGFSIFSDDFCGELFLLFGLQNHPIWREKKHQHPPKHCLQTAALTHSLQTLDRDITSHALMGSVGLRFFVFSIQWQMFWIQTTFCHFVEGCMFGIWLWKLLLQKIHTWLDFKMLVMLVRTETRNMLGVDCIRPDPDAIFVPLQPPTTIFCEAGSEPRFWQTRWCFWEKPSKRS